MGKVRFLGPHIGTRELTFARALFRSNFARGGSLAAHSPSAKPYSGTVPRGLNGVLLKPEINSDGMAKLERACIGISKY